LRTLAHDGIFLNVRTTRGASGALLIGLAAVLAGCDPGVHVAWEKDFDGVIDAACVEEALRAVAPDVSRTTYVNDGYGTRGFGRGTTVTQFNYSDPTLIGHYSLDIARLPNGKTHYWHGWSKLGTDVPRDEQAKIVPLLNRANQAVAQRCGLSFAGTGPRAGAG
jgi:hypothetical protein